MFDDTSEDGTEVRKSTTANDVKIQRKVLPRVVQEAGAKCGKMYQNGLMCEIIQDCSRKAQSALFLISFLFGDVDDLTEPKTF